MLIVPLLLILKVACITLSMLGAVAVALPFTVWRFLGFVFWTLANAGFVVYFLCHSEYALAAMYVFFLATSAVGCVNNTKDKK